MQLNWLLSTRAGEDACGHSTTMLILPFGISFSPMLLLDVVAMNPCIFFLTVSSFKEDAVVIFAS